MVDRDVALAPTTRRWRTGRSVGRTIYEQVGHEPSKADVLIGVMDTPELATAAVTGHNAVISWPTFPDEVEDAYYEPPGPHGC